ncbi:methionine adenosyltransferase domain-containing protein [Candidatus Woesearchaeota archaeon]|nr:methionine adenosyltransferase domain-containing protein [Candidatus Woesearchaeota archaeon]
MGRGLLRLINHLRELQPHSFEAGRRAKPDEQDAMRAHLIGAYILEIDPFAEFDLRVTGDFNPEYDKLEIRVSGEISDHIIKRPTFKADVADIVMAHFNKVNRTSHTVDDFLISCTPKPQEAGLGSNGNAGDSGNPIAVAYAKTPYGLPWERYLAISIRDIIDSIFQNDGQVPSRIAGISGIANLPGLRADGKVGVDALYHGASIHSIPFITIAAEHERNLPVEDLRECLGKIVLSYLESLGDHYNVRLGKPDIVINGLGAWNNGGYFVDAGSREAKPYRDGFSTHGVNEDSFSGENPKKPSGTGTFVARYSGLQLIDHDLADFAKVALGYRIGREDVMVYVTTNGTTWKSQKYLQGWIRDHVPLKINDAIFFFGLRNPALYRQIVEDSDFFQNPLLPWNKRTGYRNANLNFERAA